MKKQKSFLMLLGFLFIVFGMSSCSSETVPDGTVGLVFKRPRFFGSSGTEILPPDRYNIALTSDMIIVDVRPSKITEKFDDLTPLDDTPVDFDIFFTIVKQQSKLDSLYSNFGLEYYANNLQQEFRELVRNKCKNYTLKSLTNDEKTSKEICDYVLVEGNKIIKTLGIPVTLKAVNMGAVNPPEGVKAERANTATAKQREQTMTQNTKNEKERQNSERERALADKAYQVALGLTTEQYIQLQSIKVKEIMANKTTSVTVIEGGSDVCKLVK